MPIIKLKTMLLRSKIKTSNQKDTLETIGKLQNTITNIVKNVSYLEIKKIHKQWRKYCIEFFYERKLTLHKKLIWYIHNLLFIWQESIRT